MVRSLPFLWFLTAILLALTSLQGVGQADDDEAPAEAEAGVEPAEESPLAPLFGDPPLSAAPTEGEEAEESDEGVAELGTIEPATFEEDAEGESEEADDEAEAEEEDAEADEEETTEAESVAEEAEPSDAQPADEATPDASDAATETPVAEKTVEKEVETATFNGIRPGESTMDELHNSWGKPSQTFEDHGVVHQLFAVEPFKEIDVSFNGKTVAAIVIFMEQAFAAPALAEQLGLDNLQAVIIPDGKGRWLGQAYPERGVMFGFDPENYKEKQVA